MCMTMLGDPPDIGFHQRWCKLMTQTIYSDQLRAANKCRRFLTSLKRQKRIIPSVDNECRRCELTHLSRAVAASPATLLTADG